MSRILWNHKPFEDKARQFVLDGRKCVEREKLPYGDTQYGRWLEEREVEPTGVGYQIAASRYRDAQGRWVIPGELAPELEEVIRDVNPAYWGCYMARVVHQLAGRKGEIVQYDEAA